MQQGMSIDTIAGVGPVVSQGHEAGVWREVCVCLAMAPC